MTGVAVSAIPERRKPKKKTEVVKGVVKPKKEKMVQDDKKEEEAFRPWEDGVYGTVLQSFLQPYGFPADEIYTKKGQVITFLEKQGGGVRKFDALFTEVKA